MTDVRIVLDGPEWLVLTIDLPGIAAEAVVPWFTEAGRLARWWGEEHRIEPVVGGAYLIAWPRLGKTLRGRIAAITATTLLFSWTWDEEPEGAPRMVSLQVVPGVGGARLEVRHGPYRAADAEERAGHREGWESFLPRLRAAMAEAAA